MEYRAVLKAAARVNTADRFREREKPRDRLDREHEKRTATHHQAETDGIQGVGSV